jgi:hypothetical protein
MVPPADAPNLQLDLATGTVTLPDGLQVSPLPTRRQLLARGGGPWRVRTGAPPWRTYQREVGGEASSGCLVALTFAGDTLRQLTLLLWPSPAAAAAPDGPHELQRHAALAAALLGSDPAAAAPGATTMAWGTVRPCYDPRREQGLLEIRYAGAAEDGD